jgi:hypothetical protein
MTAPGYQTYLRTKEKLALLEARLPEVRARTDIHPVHRAAVERSYEDMMRQYLRDIKLYEAAHPAVTATPEAAEGS